MLLFSYWHSTTAQHLQELADGLARTVLGIDSFVFDVFVCCLHGFYVFVLNRRKEFTIVCGVITLLMMVTGIVLFSLIVVDLRVCLCCLPYRYCMNVIGLPVK